MLHAEEVGSKVLFCQRCMSSLFHLRHSRPHSLTPCAQKTSSSTPPTHSPSYALMLLIPYPHPSSSLLPPFPSPFSLHFLHPSLLHFHSSVFLFSLLHLFLFPLFTYFFFTLSSISSPSSSSSFASFSSYTVFT